MIEILQGNALHLPLPDESVDCVVSSPPYLGLRDYNLPATSWPEVEWTPMAGVPPIVTAATSCCLGLEADVMSYVGHMVLVARELRRVLVKTGTMWLNLGDTYASAASWGQGATGDMADRRIASVRAGTMCDPKRGKAAPGQPKKFARTGVPRKNLLGIPWRVALALQADGWYLRNEIIWHKRSPLPESCRDRATVSHEHLFLFTRRPRYFFDQAAWLEPCSPNTHLRVSQDVAAQAGSQTPDKKNGPMKAVLRDRYPSAWDNGPGSHNVVAHNAGDKAVRAKKQRKLAEPGSGIRQNTEVDEFLKYPVKKRNRRTVWTISSQPTSDAHFASFPEALVEPCIIAGCPLHGHVLDPFCGRGTVVKVANRLDRHATGIDLQPEYVQLARQRCTPDILPGSMFAEVS